ncbi:hypothetical protein ACSBOB_18515 [Mesorhizobium sp. ASY16-5R]|uniref:hypothetical protein n=1 Tax=Mesorhizobium sp. ASY16-5R TaxID=3445772 RepID=UPI003FA04E26
MKSLMLAAVSLALLTSSAGAIERYDMNSMLCAKIQATLKEQGSAILRTQSKRVPGLILYNTYFGGRDMCPTGQAPTNRRITAKDGSCLVIQCVTTGHSWMKP